jgi:SAM-dependent methyltransferase
MAHADEAADPADGLRRAWERRARSPLCEFLVASAADFENEAAADAQALLDLVGLFLGHAQHSIAHWRVLEIGCGSGRLARFIAPRVASYTGIDIAPTMVALARERCTDPRARFLDGDGRGVPPELAHERFDFVFSWAVMIHVPRDIALSNLASAWRQVAAGGELRFNFRAAASDASPLDDPAAVLGRLSAFEPPPPRVVAVPEDAVRRQTLARLLAAEPGEPAYMGHAFTRAELTAAVAAHTDGAARIVRPHPDHLYAIVRRNTT